ncbi:MAG: hypothetical protein KF764_11080 [Labilithrix sp.]|nr:hypothetical protein [Labilithrix sp.]MBX3223824.1 hypothetical protein [Labilithrix sp.]
MSRVVVVLEGRDACGKTTTARDVAGALGPETCRVIALPPPTDADRRGSYFRRWLEHLPSERGQVVVLDRSWYNRAVVERVMGFCSEAEVASFFEALPGFEAELLGAGQQLLKFFFVISEQEQARRLEGRRLEGRLTAIDATSLSSSGAYSTAEEEMLRRTSAPVPWTVMRDVDRPVRRAAVLAAIEAALVSRSAPAPALDR